LAPWLPADVDKAFDVAEQANPQLRAAQYAEQASRARVAGARAGRMPTVSLQASFGYSGGPVEPFDRGEYSRNVTGAAVVSVPLFTGGLINSQVRQSVQLNAADRIGVEGVRRGVLQSTTQAWSELVAARANIVSTAEQVRAAAIAAEGTRQEQQVGLRTTLDVLNAEQELRAAQLAQIEAKRNEYVAAASVLAVTGQLDARQIAPSVEVYDPKDNFRAVRTSWGWVPWEEPIAAVDGALTPKAQEKPLPAAPVVGASAATN
jgi:outer membrane protein